MTLTFERLTLSTRSFQLMPICFVGAMRGAHKVTHIV